ncbi:MAG: pyridoxal 5'-phosphate synthase glutaminase subunit PdxT [Candidatus Diapherotrites archaeon]
MRIGVLSLQGDFREHDEMLNSCGAQVSHVKLPADLRGLHGFVIPGGESTAILRLMERSSMKGAILHHFKKGMAIYGSCAGAIVLAKRILSHRQDSLAILDISVSRNAYGTQQDSFEAELDVKGFSNPFHGIFIRAPIIESVGAGVEILAEFEGKPVMVRSGKLLATTFHPELANDKRIHELFLRIAEK